MKKIEEFCLTVKSVGKTTYIEILSVSNTILVY